MMQQSQIITLEEKMDRPEFPALVSPTESTASLSPELSSSTSLQHPTAVGPVPVAEAPVPSSGKQSTPRKQEKKASLVKKKKKAKSKTTKDIDDEDHYDNESAANDDDGSELFLKSAEKSKKKKKKEKALVAFICNQCNKEFGTKGSLKTHSRVHTGERPYMCAVPGCGRSFTQQANCSRHIKLLHSDIVDPKLQIIQVGASPPNSNIKLQGQENKSAKDTKKKKGKKTIKVQEGHDQAEKSASKKKPKLHIATTHDNQAPFEQFVVAVDAQFSTRKRVFSNSSESAVPRGMPRKSSSSSLFASVAESTGPRDQIFSPLPFDPAVIEQRARVGSIGWGPEGLVKSYGQEMFHDPNSRSEHSAGLFHPAGSQFVPSSSAPAAYNYPSFIPPRTNSPLSMVSQGGLHSPLSSYHAPGLNVFFSENSMSGLQSFMSSGFEAAPTSVQVASAPTVTIPPMYLVGESLQYASGAVSGVYLGSPTALQTSQSFDMPTFDL